MFRIYVYVLYKQYWKNMASLVHMEIVYNYKDHQKNILNSGNSYPFFLSLFLYSYRQIYNI